jgi:hypothetical protein
MHGFQVSQRAPLSPPVVQRFVTHGPEQITTSEGNWRSGTLEQVEEDFLDHILGRRPAPGKSPGMPTQIRGVVPVELRKGSGLAVIGWGGRRNSFKGVHGQHPSRDGGYVLGVRPGGGRRRYQ